MTTTLPPTASSQQGFTLLEMAIVFVILAILLGGLIPTLSSQINQRRNNDTRAQLDGVQQALLGYAVINERLPCPASVNTNGLEDPTPPTGICNNPNSGYLPAVTLGLNPVSPQGFVLDAWNYPLRYSVSSGGTNPYTTFQGMKTTTMSLLTQKLFVCSTSTGISLSACAANTSLTSNGVPAVIFSSGQNGPNGAITNPDEAANLHAANVQTFVSHDFTPGYDDLVVWISPNTLINRMVMAGKLP